MAEIVGRDGTSECDGVGWNASDRSGTNYPDVEDRLEYYIACSDAGVGYIVGCVELDPRDALFVPPAGSIWLVCNVFAVNVGSDEVFLSPFDFAAVDAGNTRYELDFTAVALVGADESFPSTSLPPEQNVQGNVTFVVPANADKPLRIEIDAMLDFSGNTEPLVVILDPLGRVSQ